MTAQKTHQAAGSVPDMIIEIVARFREQHRSVKTAPTVAQATARLKLLYVSGAKLSRHSDELVTKMERGERWLRAHPDHPQYRERDNEWMRWEATYRFIQDALDDAKEVL
jgi:hypothetical protein